MPKKSSAKKKAAVKAVAPKTEEMHPLERGIEQFGEEVSKLGERFGARAEAKGKECESWFRSTFGIVGPFISGIFGIIMLSLMVWALAFVNAFVGSGLLSNIQLFLLANMGLIFLFTLFFSYSSYFSKCCPEVYRLFSPVFIALGVAIGFWFAANVLRIVNLSMSNPGLLVAASALEMVTIPVIWVILILGYLVVLIRMGEHKPGKAASKSVREKAVATKGKVARSSEVHRLYRSGNDRILGGVCGGIAEYLGIDPVIVRLFWVLISLPWGFGIMLYIIMWIIMPRNPNHKWD